MQPIRSIDIAHTERCSYFNAFAYSSCHRAVLLVDAMHPFRRLSVRMHEFQMILHNDPFDHQGVSIQADLASSIRTKSSPRC
jgi:hypothetical protein